MGWQAGAFGWYGLVAGRSWWQAGWGGKQGGMAGRVRPEWIFRVKKFLEWTKLLSI